MKRKPAPRPRNGAVCRSKYIGEDVRLRGRSAKVVGCARPKVRPEPAKPLPRFQVKYSGAKAPRAVPRRAVYRARRCAVEPAARGCKPFDPSKAPFVTPRAPSDRRRVLLRDRDGVVRFALVLLGGLDQRVALHPMRGVAPAPAIAEGPLRDVLRRVRDEHPEVVVPALESVRGMLAAAPRAPARAERAYEAPRAALALPAPQMPPPPSIARAPELPLPAWQPSRKEAPMPTPKSAAGRGFLARLMPETRPLADALVQYAPWAWPTLAGKMGRIWGFNAVTGEPFTHEEKCRAYGTVGYSSGYGYNSSRDVCKELNPFHAPSEIERTSAFGIHYAVRPSVEKFIENVARVVFAIEFAEWANTVGVRRRQAGGSYTLRQLQLPADMVFPKGQAGATNEMHRRRRAEQIRNDQRWFAAVPERLAEAVKIVNGWFTNGAPALADFYALPSQRVEWKHQSRIEFMRTWLANDEDWRIYILRGDAEGRREDGEIHVEVWRRGAWRRRFVGRWDFVRDRIPVEDAPQDVQDAVRAGLGSFYLSSIFGGGYEARRRSEEGAYLDGKEIPVDPFATGCGEADPEIQLAVQMASRIRCLNKTGRRYGEQREIRERLDIAHRAALRAACPDFGDAENPRCARYFEMLAAGCTDTCDPNDDGGCPKQILPSQIAAWGASPHEMPAFVFDSDKPHRIGSTPNCYFSREMQQRLALHAKVMADLNVPLDVQRQGEAAERAWIVDRMRAAERAALPADAEQYARNDERILSRAVKLAAMRAPVSGRGGNTQLANAVRIYDIYESEGVQGAVAYGQALMKALGIDPDAGATLPTEITEAVAQAYVDVLAMNPDPDKRRRSIDDFRAKALANVKRREKFTAELVTTLKRTGKL